MDPELEPTPATPVKPTHPLLPVLLTLVVILVMASGFLAYQNIQLRSQIASMQTTPSPTPTAILDPTVNWKTYTDPDGFTFKYPVQWSEPWANCVSPTPESMGRGGYLNPNCLSTLFFPKKDIQDLADEDPLLYPELASQLNLTIDGHTAKKRLFASDQGEPPQYYEVKIYNNTVPIFAWITTIGPDTDQIHTQQLIQTLDQILSTFKFL